MSERKFDHNQSEEEALKRLGTYEILDYLNKNRAKKDSPENSEKGDEMGTQRVLDELAIKYEQENNNEKEEALKRLGTYEILDYFKAKAKARFDRLENVPFDYNRIPQDELRQMIVVTQFLDQFKKEKVIDRQNLAELERQLDRLDLWSFKFSTMPGSGNGEPLIINKDRDSVYYVSHSGSSLRLRKVSIEEGYADHVIQPMLERIFYRMSGELSLEPKIGFWVCEYSSREFDELLRSGTVDSDFESGIKIYKDADKIVDILEASNSSDHNGDRINHIYF